MPYQLVHVDPTALENLAHEKKLQELLFDQPQPDGGQLASQCCSGTSNPEDSPEDTIVQSQPEGKIKAQPGQDIALLPVCILKTY